MKDLEYFTKKVAAGEVPTVTHRIVGKQLAGIQFPRRNRRKGRGANGLLLALNAVLDPAFDMLLNVFKLRVWESVAGLRPCCVILCTCFPAASLWAIERGGETEN